MFEAISILLVAILNLLEAISILLEAIQIYPEAFCEKFRTLTLDP